MSYINHILKIPIPQTISFLWNFGSLLGICLVIQIISGLFLAFRYYPDASLAFMSISNIINNSWNGFIFRNIHANGASLFFICLYIHIGRGVFYKSFMFKLTWSIGVIMFFTIMGTAFLGYVLPWGQMSFWGASVITNLISSIPYLGNSLVIWVWGGHSVDNATLTRFFCLHFILPFMILAMMVIHLTFLHITGSNNPLNLNKNFNKIYFNPIFSIKDLMWVLIFFAVLLLIMMIVPFLFMDSDNFLIANPMVTPEHIQPEWYFLFAYAILRSIPSKLGGVIALLMSILILIFLPIFYYQSIISNMHFPIMKNINVILFNNVALLTWIGIKPVEFPFLEAGMMLSFTYFMLFIIAPTIHHYLIKII